MTQVLLKELLKDRINQLSSYAIENGLKIRFRNRTTKQGDFCIFIYKPEGGRYLCGFDGYWNGYPGLSFNDIYQRAIDYIESYGK